MILLNSQVLKLTVPGSRLFKMHFLPEQLGYIVKYWTQYDLQTIDIPLSHSFAYVHGIFLENSVSVELLLKKKLLQGCL